MIAALRALERDDSGTAIIEYALVLTLVSMVSYAALYSIGSALEAFFITSSAGLANVAEQPR